MKRRLPLQKMTSSKQNQSAFGYTFRSLRPSSNYLNKINSILKDTTINVNTQTQKGHPKIERSKNRMKTDTQTSLQYINSSTIPNKKEEKLKMSHLLNQNIFLMNQLMIHRYREQEYLQTIKQLRQSKSEQQISFSRANSKYVKIQKLSQSIQSLTDELSHLIQQQGSTRRKQHTSEMQQSLKSLYPRKKYVSMQQFL